MLVTELGPDHKQMESQFLWSLLLEVSSLVGKVDFSILPSYLYNYRLR